MSTTDKILEQVRQLSFHEKTALIKAIVDMMETDFGNLVLASNSSISFWDNPVDDEAWNED